MTQPIFGFPILFSLNRRNLVNQTIMASVVGFGAIQKRSISSFTNSVPVLDEILEATLTNRMTVLAVLATLYELWFTRFNQNPVRLTSYSLRKYGISRHQKIRVLKLLERSGQIAVERSRGENPLVTLKWLPLQKEKT